MIDDKEGLLLGLYRESSSCITIEERLDGTIKEIVLNGVLYILKETKICNIHIWNLYTEDNLVIDIDEVINIFAIANCIRKSKI